jgi:hypothetical protein
LAGDIHALTQRAPEIDFEAGKLIVVEIIIGRPRAFAGDADLCPLGLGGNRRRIGAERQGKAKRRENG